MAARVLFFGATADIAGEREIELSVTNGLTAGAVLDTLIERMPRLAAHKLYVSVNQRYALHDVIIREGDELAVFTPVSGG